MNLRPSGYEPDELPGCSTPRWCRGREERDACFRGSVCGSGGDLLSHALRRSTIGAAGLNGRVREGIGCFPRALTAGPADRALHGRAVRVVFPMERLRGGDGALSFGGPSVFRVAIKPIERLVPVD